MTPGQQGVDCSRSVHLQDEIVAKQISDARARFIDSLREGDIRQLAAQFHPRGSEGEFFQDRVRGSYNVCYFIRFPSSSASSSSPQSWDKWVVRIPLEPCLPFGASQKLGCEIATMKLISQRTSIPIPTLIAYGINDKSKPFPNFMILEFVEAEKLTHKRYHEMTTDQRQQLYCSMADIFIQLRRLEFGAIGRLAVDDDAGFVVRNPIVTMDINAQALEGIEPSEVLARYEGGGPLHSSSQYINLLHDLADHAFRKGRTSIIDDDAIGKENLYNLHIFRSIVRKWRAESDERGPFVLVHGDFQPFNLLVNNSGRIMSVLDWEWSRIVPRQFFNPPLWLRVADTTLWSHPIFYEHILETLQDFLRVVRQKELERFGETTLADEWETGQHQHSFLISHALESWTHVDWYCAHQEDRKGLDERIEAFMASDPRRGDLVAQKIRDGAAYNADLQRSRNAKPTSRPWFSSRMSHLLWRALHPVARWRKQCTLPLLVPGITIMLIFGGGVIGYRLRRWLWT